MFLVDPSHSWIIDAGAKIGDSQTEGERRRERYRMVSRAIVSGVAGDTFPVWLFFPHWLTSLADYCFGRKTRGFSKQVW